MINHFRAQMPRPLIGIGHSMGGNNLVNLSLMHPRLLETLILIDPVIQRFGSAQGNYAPAQSSAFRRDRWPSRAAAAEAFKRNKFYQTWDPRVLDRWIQHGLRDIPTLVYPSSADKASSNLPLPATTTPEPSLAPSGPQAPEVTLTTTKHQEVFTFLRPIYSTACSSLREASGAAALSAPSPTRNRLTHPDIHPTTNPSDPIYRPEPIITFHNLPHLRPSVLYVFGSLSALSSPELRADKMTVTGTGVSGSGGAEEGRVKEVLLEGVGHLIPMEAVGVTADRAVEWLGSEMERWRVNERLVQAEWEGKKGAQRAVMDERFLEMLGSIPGLPQRKKREGKL